MLALAAVEALNGLRSKVPPLAPVEEREVPPTEPPAAPVTKKPSPRTEGATLHNLAQASEYAGEAQEALSGYEAALRLFKSSNSPVRAASTQTNLAWVYLKLGDAAQAQRLIEEALGGWG